MKKSVSTENETNALYVTEPEGVKRLRTDLIARHPRYERAHTLHYYKRLLNWSDSGQHRCHNWSAKAAGFIDGDETNGKLVTCK